MQSFQINSAPQAGPKNYVFVDEHNRHKRLKVMRACEGCRRRKIKCDSATTNTWPCAACVRLKLHCVPPTGGPEGDFVTTTAPPNGQSTVDYQTFNQSPVDVHHPGPPGAHFPQTYGNQPYDQFGTYDHGYPSSKDNYAFAHDEQYLYGGQQLSDPSLASFTSPQVPFHPVRADSDGQLPAQTPISQYTAEDLSLHLGDLKINENGIAPYVRQQKPDEDEAEGPIEEADVKISAFSTAAGAQIRIPPALMPQDDDALEYFSVFFRDVHPYVPVLCRSQFYEQWNKRRDTISPLLLEAVFACAGRITDDPVDGAQWLAMANKHEPSFLDAPRLSTVQALLILLKAREGAPKRGYYYRSWTLTKQAVSMAKDLDLHEHHEIHEAGESCGSDPAECLTKTRVWQTCLIVEMMVGAPQGRTDMSVDPNSVDISPNPPCSDIDDFERSISRQFAYFLRNARNIRLITEVARKLKRKEDWGLDKELIKYNVAFHQWPGDLPSDLQVKMPQDGSAPKLASHFIGNMHSHYHLGIVMLRRAQLTASEKFADDETWKQHMAMCYKSAKALCRLQEAILAKHDLGGLLVMQRGINFTIYAILTCVMIHLIAITSPDPDFNTDARDFFVRHMRILEKCVAAWPMPGSEDQINALRSAFSADINKPFELKPSFPLGSSPDSYGPSPPAQQMPQSDTFQHQQPPQVMVPSNHSYMNQHMGNLQTASYLATPPVSAVSDSKPQSPLNPHAYDMNAQIPPMPAASFYHQTLSPHEAPQWNPTPIIEQFNTAFSIPASALAPPGYTSSPPIHMSNDHGYMQNTPSPPYPAATTFPPSQQHQAYYAELQRQQRQNSMPYMDNHGDGMPQQAQMAHGQPMPQQRPPGYGQPPPDSVYVTPKQWQQSVQSVYEGGLKRRWDAMGHGGEPVSKRR